MPETVGVRYASTRRRLSALLTPLGEQEWETPVPACPGWRVRDVLAHLVGNLEDGAAGRLTGPPGEDQTAEQVLRHTADDPRDLLETWAVATDLAEATLTATRAWPAFIDAVSHEHDIRHAQRIGGGRAHDDVRCAARLVADPITVPGGIIELAIDDAAAPPRIGSGTTYRLRASAFEVLRVRLGRRSVDEVRALDWSTDPAPVLDHLFVFGPRRVPLAE